MHVALHSQTIEPLSKEIKEPKSWMDYRTVPSLTLRELLVNVPAEQVVFDQHFLHSLLDLTHARSTRARKLLLDRQRERVRRADAAEEAEGVTS